MSIVLLSAPGRRAVYVADGALFVLPTWVPTALAHVLGRFGGAVMSGRDASKAEGALIPYNVAHVAVGHVEHAPGIPIGFWRSVSHSFCVFVVESFIDELVHKAGRDYGLSAALKALANAAVRSDRPAAARVAAETGGGLNLSAGRYLQRRVSAMPSICNGWRAGA